MSTNIGTATSYLDLINQLDAFLTTTGHAWGKTYTGTGTGDMTAYLGTATSVAETFTVTATGATTFTVVGTISGALANATAGTPYTSAKIVFTITAGGTAFQAGDQFVINTSPPWTRLRGAGCPDVNKRTSNITNYESLFNGAVDSSTTIYRAAPNGYVEFEMMRPSEIREIVVNVGDNYTNTSPSAFSLQWKNNVGDAWTTAQSWTGQTWTSAYQGKTYTLTTAPGEHKYWRFEVTAVNGTQTLSMGELTLRQTPGASYRLDEHAEFVWQGPGLDGAKQIYVGLETYGASTTDTYNFGFTGFRAYDNTLNVQAQPNGITARYMYLVNSPIGFWIVANGQRFILVTKAAGVYQTAYCGFGLAYETPTYHAYPSIIAATNLSRTTRYNTTNGSYRHPADPGAGGFMAFYPDAQWRSHANRTDQGGTTDGASDNSTQGKVWPSTTDFGSYMPSYLRENLDGSRPLMPLVLWHQSSPTHVWGEMQGYYWTTGLNTVAEAIVREANFDHLVVNNMFRIGVQHYAAVRLD